MKSEQFTFATWIFLDTLEVPSLDGSSVADVRLLLFVNLSGVHNFLNGSNRDQPIYLNIAPLTNSVCSVLGLEILSLEVSVALKQSHKVFCMKTTFHEPQCSASV